MSAIPKQNHDEKPSPILDGFAHNLQKLIELTLAEKSNALDTKEKELQEREAKVEKVLGTLAKGLGNVVLRVGDRLFYTSADILLSRRDSYFAGMLNKDFHQAENGIYFIPREAQIFEYVLEFLIYGKMVSTIDNENILKKLIIDADFYLLPELKDAAHEQLSCVQNNLSSQAIYAKFNNASCSDNKQFWQWEGMQTSIKKMCSLSTTRDHNDTITITLVSDLTFFSIILNCISLPCQRARRSSSGTTCMFLLWCDP